MSAVTGDDDAAAEPATASFVVQPAPHEEPFEEQRGNAEEEQ